MGAKEQLNAWADEQGWNDNSKVELLCRFIDNLGFVADMPNVDFVKYLDEWLENQVEWENLGDEEKGEDDGS